ADGGGAVGDDIEADAPTSAQIARGHTCAFATYSDPKSHAPPRGIRTHPRRSCKSCRDRVNAGRGSGHGALRAFDHRFSRLRRPFVMTGPAAGRVIAGRYALEGLLKSGGMGSVWTARHVELDMQVAVKFIASELLASQSARTRFTREARAAALLRTPHVVQIFD